MPVADECCVLGVRHFVAINGKRHQHQSSRRRLLIKPSGIRPANERARQESRSFLPATGSSSCALGRPLLMDLPLWEARRFFKRSQLVPRRIPMMGKLQQSEDGKKKHHFEFGFEHVCYRLSGAGRPSTSISLAQRNPIVISVRQNFAANRLESRALCSVSRHDPPRTTLNSPSSGPFGSR